MMLRSARSNARPAKKQTRLGEAWATCRKKTRSFGLGSARRAGVRLRRQARPAPMIPAKGADAEPEVAVAGGVVVVVGEVVAVHRLPARSYHRAVLGEDHGAAAVQERSPELVVVRPGDGAGAANGDLVRALEPSAAEVERDEQGVVPATAHDVGSLARVGWGGARPAP